MPIFRAAMDGEFFSTEFFVEADSEQEADEFATELSSGLIGNGFAISVLDQEEIDSLSEHDIHRRKANDIEA